MSDKHTPGPWEWDGNPCNYDRDEEAPWLWQAPWKAEESFPILSGSIKCGNEADARLIAAAPDLLEALKECERYGGGYANCNESYLPPTVREKARAAIAKAEAK